MAKHKSNATLNESALIGNDFLIFPFVLEGFVYWFIIIKVCFTDRFSLKLDNYFSEIEPLSHYGSTTSKKM